MTLAAGSRLGPYEIAGRIGEGGLGVVYRARDTRLHRDVAIKILAAERDEVSDRQRFDREAQAISHLNHPNICTLFDVGAEQGTSYLVMELIDGETLADLLARERLPRDAALRYAVEIARALDCAHRAGIIHRDLKPSNIMITRGGVKLLDFGLARLPVARPSDDSSTLVKPLTAEGMVVGTPQYMAPEQLAGRAIDARADLYAFGCVLYEMLTGLRLFEAPMERVEPPSLDRLLRKCLAKAPDERWQSAGDLATTLEWIAEDAGYGVRRHAAAFESGSMLPHSIAVALLAVLVILAIWLPKRPAEPAVLRFSAPVVADRLALGHTTRILSLSPDGRTLLYTAVQNGKSMLWLRSLAGGTAAPIPNTEGAGEAVWSPDSQQIAFVSARGIMKVTPRGENLMTIAGGSTLPAWGADRTIVYTARGRELMRVSENGGTPERLPIAPLRPNETIRWPVFAGRDRIAYCVIRDDELRLHLLTLGENSDEDLGAIGSRVEVVDGVLLFVRDGALLAQRVDGSLARTSEPVQLASGVSNYGTFGTARFSASSTAIAYLDSETDARATWFDAGGNVLGTVGPAGTENPARISPDGTKAVLAVTDPHTGTDDLWVCDLQRDTAVRLTDSRESEGLMSWSPDGRIIAFVSDRGNALRIIPAAGGEPATVAAMEGLNFPRDWIASGLILGGSSGGLTLLAPRTKATALPWMPFPFSCLWARVSPDGRYVAFASRASGELQIHVAPIGQPSDAIQVSTGGGIWPAWNADSRELYYATQTNEVYAARMTGASPLDFEKPRLLFRAPAGEWDGFDAARDGRRFLVTRVLSGPSTRPINVIANWKQLLTQ